MKRIFQKSDTEENSAAAKQAVTETKECIDETNSTARVSRNKKGIMILLICVFILLVGYHGYSHYMVSQFYKYIDADDTVGALSCIEKMPNVNMLDKCRPLYNLEGLLSKDSTTKEYPLYYAVSKRAGFRVMEALLEKGADPNKKSFSFSDTPIQCLCGHEQNNMYEKLTLLIEYGADVSEGYISIPAPWTDLNEESKERAFRTIVFLWENGVDEWQYAGTEDERTVLHSAAQSMDAEYLEKLYKNEKRPMEELLNALDANGETPLFYAVRTGKFNNCSFLLEVGADITIKNNEGKTAYDIAVELGYEEYVKGLMPREGIIIPEKLLGEWRVSRILLLPEVYRTDLIISYNYGRTITITENKIDDSIDADTMGPNDWDDSMHGLYETEVSKADSPGLWWDRDDFYNNGIPCEEMEQIIIKGYWDKAAGRGFSEDGEMDFYLLNDHTMIKSFNTGFYLLKKQETEAIETVDIKALYGNYKVTELVSKDIPTSKAGATEFFGQSFYWDENGIYDGRNQKYILSGAAQMEVTDIDEFYETHMVETGLGLTNDRIMVWEQENGTVIPVNTEEVIIKLPGGWYRMVKNGFIETSLDDVNILSGSLWKPQQILSYTEGTEEELQESARAAEYLLADWIYITEEDVKGFDVKTGSTEELEETYHMLDGFGSRKDELFYFVDENTENVYLILDENKLIGRVDGVWYFMTRIVD